MTRSNSVALAALNEAQTQTSFRAIRSGAYRRGIRLEQIYWNTLKEISAAQGVAMGELVRATELRYPRARNITSLLRVMCLAWLKERFDKTRALADLAMVDSLVQASPAPAFALTEDKRIVVYNQAFLNFVQSRFSLITAGTMAKGLRLSLDVQLSDLIHSLGQNRNRPAGTGFAIGIEQQRIRGRLTVVLAPSAEQAIIIAYVLPN